MFTNLVSLMTPTRKCGVMTAQVSDLSVCTAFHLHQLIPVKLGVCEVHVSI